MLFAQGFYTHVHTSTMNDEFDALVHETFYKLMDFRPDLATFFGLHQYDKKMPAATREAEETYITFLSEYLKKFQDVPHEGLSSHRKIDRKLMISILRYDLFKESKIRRWEKDPDLSETIGDAVFLLFSREFAPFDHRLESIVSRLSKCPQFIKESETKVEKPVKLWVDMAVEGCNALPLFFQIISETAQQKGLDTTELDEASAKTADALSKYVEWVTTLPCEGEPILGKDLFEELLKVRELGLTGKEILKIGEDYLTKEKARLRKLASLVDLSSSAEEVRTTIRKDHPPTFQEALKAYEKAILKMRDTVREEEFASIPEGERLIVRETPTFMRHLIPTAAYIPPATFEKDQTGIYLVTPVEGDLLQEHNYTAIVNTSVHEAYPGHHLHSVWINKNPSLVRILSDPPEFAEGWAHYCEERMREYGLNDIKLQIAQTIDVIFRAVRIIIDVNLHCGQMTFDEAVSLLRSETGMEQYAVVAEVKRYTKEPGYPLSYLLGKHLFLQLRKDVQEHMKEKYSEKQFHNTMLQGGSMPFVYLREELKLKGML